jgi:hypothetical protein
MTGAVPRGLVDGAGGRFGIAYTSYAVRMLRGGDIFKTTAAALPAERFVDLCVEAGASGCQMDLSQLAATDAAALSSVRALVERHGLFLELSVPFRWFETPEAFEHVAGICHALGATRLRVGLLFGRRYDSFVSM